MLRECLSKRLKLVFVSMSCMFHLINLFIDFFLFFTIFMFLYNSFAFFCVCGMEKFSQKIIVQCSFFYLFLFSFHSFFKFSFYTILTDQYGFNCAEMKEKSCYGKYTYKLIQNYSWKN